MNRCLHRTCPTMTAPAISLSHPTQISGAACPRRLNLSCQPPVSHIHIRGSYVFLYFAQTVFALIEFDGLLSDKARPIQP